MELTQSSIKQLISQSKLLRISISTLITIKNKQVQKPTRRKRKQTPHSTSTIKERLKLSSSKCRQSKGSATQTDDSNPRITNMRRILRSRSPYRRNTLTPKTRPLITNPGWNQPMLSNAKKINTSMKSKITMSEPATNIMKLNANMLGLGGGPRCLALPAQKCHKMRPQKRLVGFRLNRKTHKGEKEVSLCFCLQFLRSAPLVHKTIYAL